MSSEEKALNPNPSDNQSDSDIEPVEAELADSEQVGDLGVEEPIEASIVEDQAFSEVNDSDDKKVGNTGFFEEQDVSQGVNVAMASGDIPIGVDKVTPPALASNLQNLSANGGAFGALVLGVWCFLGSFITNWSIINGVLGLLLGTWGLTSRRKKTAWVGIVLCTIGILLCLAEFSELVNQWWYAEDDTIG